MIDPFVSAVDLAALIRSGEVTAADVAQFYLDRVDAINPEVNAIVWIDREDVLARAKSADARIAAGAARPFEGVPIPIKDLSPVAGQPYSLSGLGLDEVIAEQSTPAVRSLEDAGFVLFGRSNAPEFGPMIASENMRHGQTRNPWNPEYSPGGSSGGAAAALAAGFSPVAHASDGGGSIRIPSSGTGLVGLKPSRGRVPASVRAWEHGVGEGAITRTVGDAAAMLDVLAGYDSLAYYNAPVPTRSYVEELGAPQPRLRVGLLLEPTWDVELDREPIEAAQILAAALEAAGHTIVPVSEPILFSKSALDGYFEVVIDAECRSVPFQHLDRVEPYIRYRWERGGGVDSGEYVRVARQLQLEMRDVVAHWSRDFDVLLTPAVGKTMLRVGEALDEANTDLGGPHPLHRATVAFTMPVNVAGLPAMSLPVHESANGTRVGAQLIGAPWDEATILRLAAEVEPEFRWQESIAPLAQP
jgi:amidase